MSVTHQPDEPPKNDQPTLFALWDKYEEAAKHFNDLNMRWRLQAMGGLAGLTTLAGFVVGGQDNVVARLRAMILFSFMLMLGWVGVALLDLCYYNDLLYGAGEAIRKLEDKTRAWALPVDLSTHLDEKVLKKGRWMPLVFYVLGFIPLLCAFLWGALAYCSLPDSERALMGRAQAVNAVPPRPDAGK